MVLGDKRTAAERIGRPVDGVACVRNTLECRIAAGRRRTDRWEEAHIVINPAAAAVIAHADRKVLSGAHRPETNPALPPLVVPDEVRRSKSLRRGIGTAHHALLNRALIDRLR